MTPEMAEKTSLQITRLIKARPQRVYAAWTDPVQLKQWFGPEMCRRMTLPPTCESAENSIGT